jgi:hypothetical protein
MSNRRYLFDLIFNCFITFTSLPPVKSCLYFILPSYMWKKKTFQPDTLKKSHFLLVLKEDGFLVRTRSVLLMTIRTCIVYSARKLISLFLS